MMKQVVTILWVMYQAVTCLSATILEVSTMDELVSTFERANQKTLAIFDIDMVLIQPEDPAFQMANMKRFSPIVKSLLRSLSPDKIDTCWTLMTLRSDSVLVDLRFPGFLQSLNQRKIPLMALTNNFTGRFGEIESMELWKAQQLQAHGIDFRKMAPTLQEFQFENSARYIDGILFCNGSQIGKGPLLIQFLEKAALSPEEIIFVDDREENVLNVQQALTAFRPETRFSGVHFTLAKNYPSLAISEEEFQAKWQQIAQEALQENIK